MSSRNTYRFDPAEVDVDIYVGLGHLEPDQLKIRKWGHPNEVKGTKLRFWPGDIIFGRRRFYQRKLAVAEFDGICSAHAMVLRAREDVCLTEFLPFFMQSQTFFERAMDISVGSLSPTINWSTLRQQEFALPPLEQQRQIAEILWAADKAIERMRDCFAEHEAVKDATMRALLRVNPADRVPLSEVGELLSGGTPSRSQAHYWNGEIPWASPKDMKVDVLFSTEETITEKGVENGTRVVQENTILVVVRGMILDHTFPVALTGHPMAFNQDMKALDVGPDFDPRYVFYWLQGNAQHILHLVSETSHGTKRIPTEMLLSLQIPKFSKERQAEISSLIMKCDNASAELRAHCRRLESLKRSLLNTLL